MFSELTLQELCQLDDVLQQIQNQQQQAGKQISNVYDHAYATMFCPSVCNVFVLRLKRYIVEDTVAIVTMPISGTNLLYR